MFFRDIVGQQQICTQLIANVHSKRLGHALLLLGPEGSGHLPIALALATYIHCTNKQASDACGECPSCLKMKKLVHPDIHFYFPVATNHRHKKDVSSKLFYPEWRAFITDRPYFSYSQWLETIGIENKQAIINTEDCNDIIRTLGLKSYESPFKVVLIFMLEKIYHAAAPRLLKILEEPPHNTLFLLVAENKELILNTILSRAQLIRLSLPGSSDIERALTKKHGVSSEEARHLAFLSSGNMAEALRMIDENINVYENFGSFRDWMRLCFKGDIPNMLTWVENMAKSGREKQKAFLGYGMKIFRMCMLNNYDAASLISLGNEEQEFLGKFSPFITPKNILPMVEAFNQSVYHIERNANPKILFADLSLTLTGLIKPTKNESRASAG